MSLRGGGGGGDGFTMLAHGRYIPLFFNTLTPIGFCKKGNIRNIPLFFLLALKTRGIKFCKTTAQMSHMGNNKHHEPIDPADIDKCYKSSVFDQDSPASLQAKVWFELSLFLCRRGRENLKDLKKDHFEVRRDANGREYLAQVLDELTKKTREDNMSSRTDGGRMYATGRADCPVASYKKYCEKLNKDNNNLFQTPKQSMPQSGPWYKKSSVGKNTLGDMMSTISKKAGLSRIYTNHCVRATCIGILDKAGFANREICQVSGHNNESSLSSYTGRVCNNTKMAMSDTISHALGGHQEVARPAPAATVSVPPEQDENQPPVPPGGGALTYIGSIGMCGP